MNKRLLLIIVGVVAVTVSVGAFLSVGAQNNDDNHLECEDPLAGLNIRFNRSFWQDTNFCKSSIDLETVLSGGPPPDGIPPIDNPNYESMDGASEWLVEESPVVAVTVNGETRGYPLAVLTWHEIVNTEIGGEPVTVTFCPLCNSAIVFFRTIDGEVLDFGVSGNLRNSDLIMYDRQTDSWWQQFTGEGIVGDYTGTNLEMIPSQIVGFSQFQEEFPDAEVLSRDTGTSRRYGVNPYAGYDGVENPFLFDGELDRRLPATSRVLAGYVAGEAIAYPFGPLQDEIAINDTVNERDIVAFWQPGVRSALDQSQIDQSRDVGTAAIYSRELEDGTILTFSATEDGLITDDQTGSIWNPFGRAIEGELTDTQLRQIVAGTHFWFAWAAFEPESIVYGFE
jgi:hypothetical protein